MLMQRTGVQLTAPLLHGLQSTGAPSSDPLGHPHPCVHNVHSHINDTSFFLV